jgi:hypothetical protein
MNLEKYIVLHGSPIKLPKPHADFVDFYYNNMMHDKKFGVIHMRKARQVGFTSLSHGLSLALAMEEVVRVYHLHPTMAMAAQSAQKINDMILDAPRGMTKKRNGLLKSVIEEKLKWGPQCDTKTRKEFENGSSILTESTGNNACRLRGGSCDISFFHESQRMEPEAMRNASHLSSHSQFGVLGLGVQTYMFTPQEEDDYSDHMWKDSDQRRFHYRCENCSCMFPIMQSNFREIWLYGFTIRCPECHREQDKRNAMKRGEWIATATESHVAGFHMDQSTMEFFSRESIDACYNDRTMTERNIANEVWGESFPKEQ